MTLPDADIEFIPNLFSASEADSIFENLKSEVPWEQDTITFYGKRHDLPRLTCWFGDPGARYTYSKISNEPRPWTPLITELKQRVEAASQHGFNSVLLNFYRSGR